MIRNFASHAYLLTRPLAWVDAVDAATLSRTERGVWFDADHPALAAFRGKPLLAGDVAEALLTRMGVKGAVEWLEVQTGIECGCASRKLWLDAVGEKIKAAVREIV